MVLWTQGTIRLVVQIRFLSLANSRIGESYQWFAISRTCWLDRVIQNLGHKSMLYKDLINNSAHEAMMRAADTRSREIVGKCP